MSSNDNKAVIYDLQAIKDSLSAADFMDALTEYEVILTFTHPLHGLLAVEIKAQDNRFRGSKCFSAKWGNGRIDFSPCDDLFPAGTGGTPPAVAAAPGPAG